VQRQFSASFCSKGAAPGLVAHNRVFIDYDPDGFVFLIQHHDAHWYFEAAVLEVLGENLCMACVHLSGNQNAAVGTCSAYYEGQRHPVSGTFIDNSG
jgi:hypothetical protein